MTTSQPRIDTKAYGRLLMKAHPGVIKSEAENDRLLAIVEGLMAKGEDRLSAEEDALLELLLQPRSPLRTAALSHTAQPSP
jgi:hypothetical protein